MIGWMGIMARHRHVSAEQHGAAAGAGSDASTASSASHSPGATHHLHFRSLPLQIDVDQGLLDALPTLASQPIYMSCNRLELLSDRSAPPCSWKVCSTILQNQAGGLSQPLSNVDFRVVTVSWLRLASPARGLLLLLAWATDS
jgi:hypothetical protein